MKNIVSTIKEFVISILIRVQNPDKRYNKKLLQHTGENHQNITYCKTGKFENIGVLAHVQIDAKNALRETLRLLPQYEERIGFINAYLEESVNFKRLSDDDWFVDVPIVTRGKLDGYFYWAQSDTRGVVDIIRLFFDGLDWFSILDFKMNRLDFKHLMR
ncbi:MAG: hypothetical protein OXC46_02140 [Thaumarchaeota archaeon]|nr:hypothetical protein [Nitrososphaerota archaeon]